MSVIMELNPFEFFTDTAGTALDAGYIWIGQVNSDPRNFPVTVYYDAALTIPAPMPLRTTNGYIYRNGSPTFLYINGNYSIMVLQKNLALVYYVPDFLMIGSGAAVSLGDLANTTDPTKGISIIPTAARLVPNIATLKTLPKTGGSVAANVQGYYARGDGGGGEYYLDAADVTSVDNGGTIIVANDGGRWKISSTTIVSDKQYGAKGDGVTDDTARLQAYAIDGGALRIGTGTYVTNSSITIDYNTLTSGGVATSFIGFMSKRYGIFGDSWANSIIVASGAGFAFRLLGSFPVTQNFSGNDCIENLTITNPVRNLPNTTNSGASGVLCQVKAYTDIKRYTAINLALGLQLDGVLTSKLEDVLIQGCYQGIIANNTLGASGPNSMIWSKVKVGDSTSNGVVCDVGSASHFDTITVEGCGTVATGSCGMVLSIPVDQIAPVITLTNPYFELNKGVADIYINNLGTAPATVIIEGGVFARANATNYTVTNIQAHSSGGGRVTVLLKGCHFLSVGGYVPNAGRPFWIEDSSVCKIIPDEFCTFNETTSLVGSKKFALTTPVVINTSGTIIGGDATAISCTKTGTGQYRFDAIGGQFGETVLDYSVSANPCDSAATGLSLVQSIRFQPISNSRFFLNSFVGVTLTDGPIALQICGSKNSF